MKKTFTLLTLFFCCHIVYGQKGLVKYEIRAGMYGSSPSMFTYAFGNAYFNAFDNVTDNEIWYCQGANPPQMLTNFYNTGIILGAAGGALYFTAATKFTQELDIYKYDGVNPPAYLLTVAPGDSATNIAYGCVLDGKLYFRARTKSLEFAIWCLDPATDQVQMVYDPPYYFEKMTAYNHKLYFTPTQTPGIDYELREFDPATSIETIFDINPGALSSFAECLDVIDGRLYLTAKEPSYGKELYVFDGQGQPQRITDIMPGSADGVYLPSPTGLNGIVYFIAYDSPTQSADLYKYDPTTGTVSLVVNVYHQHNVTINNLCAYGNNLYMGASDGQGVGVELMVYDLVNPPFIIADAKNPGSSYPIMFRVYNNSLYFNGMDQGAGTELFKYTDSALTVEKTVPNSVIHVYPNPAQNEIRTTIKHNKTENLVIIFSDMLGRIVHTGHISVTTGTSHAIFSLDKLPSGTYLCRVQNSKGQLYHQAAVIKE